jgi:hypothetical protein
LDVAWLLVLLPDPLSELLLLEPSPEVEAVVGVGAAGVFRSIELPSA